MFHRAPDLHALIAGNIAPADGRNSGCTNDTDRVAAGIISGAYTLGPGVKVGAAVVAWNGWGDDGNENFDGISFQLGTGLNF